MTDNENEYFEYDNLDDEIEQNGFAIFSRIRHQIPGYYPNVLSQYREIAIEDLKDGDVVIFRAFFPIIKGERIDSGIIEGEIELVQDKEIWVNILTRLPDSFPLQKGTSIELRIDEILEIPE